jgi:uncharacterized Zn-binding protein involved in type VI secretion
MLGRFGTSLFAATEFLRRLIYKARRVACVGDTSTHGGSIITSNQDGTLKVNGLIVAVDGAQFSCPIDGHGVTSITSIIQKTRQNGKLIVTEGAFSGCGALIKPPDRKVYTG